MPSLLEPSLGPRLHISTNPEIPHMLSKPRSGCPPSRTPARCRSNQIQISAARPALGGMRRAPRALLDGIRAEFESPPLAHEELWIYLLSDLLEDPPRGSRPVEEHKDDSSLAGAHIVLVYPHESEQANWSRVKAYWRGQFKGDEITIIPFSRVLDSSCTLYT
jgi:hypothetical protein